MLFSSSFSRSVEFNSGTRAAEEGYKTNFTASDACGLYIVRTAR